MQFFLLRFSLSEWGKWKKFLIFPTSFQPIQQGVLSSSPQTLFHREPEWSLASLESSLPLELQKNWVVLLFLNIPGLDYFMEFSLFQRTWRVGSYAKQARAWCFYPCSRAEWHRTGFLPLAMPSPTQTPVPGAHHSTQSTQNKARGSKPSNLFYHFGKSLECGLLTSGGYPSYKRRCLSDLES